MPSRDIAIAWRPAGVVYDAVMCGPEEECDRQGGAETACRAHAGKLTLMIRALTCLVEVAGDACYEAWLLAGDGAQYQSCTAVRVAVDGRLVLSMLCTKRYGVSPEGAGATPDTSCQKSEPGRSTPHGPPQQPLYMSPSVNGLHGRLVGVVVNNSGEPYEEAQRAQQPPDRGIAAIGASTRRSHLGHSRSDRRLSPCRCRQAPPCPCQTPGPPGCSSVKCIADVLCL
jgi:hypothetical protein